MSSSAIDEDDIEGPSIQADFSHETAATTVDSVLLPTYDHKNNNGSLRVGISDDDGNNADKEYTSGSLEYDPNSSYCKPCLLMLIQQSICYIVTYELIILH